MEKIRKYFEIYHICAKSFRLGLLYYYYYCRNHNVISAAGANKDKGSIHRVISGNLDCIKKLRKRERNLHAALSVYRPDFA